MLIQGVALVVVLLFKAIICCEITIGHLFRQKNLLTVLVTFNNSDNCDVNTEEGRDRRAKKKKIEQAEQNVTKLGHAE